MPTKTLTKVLDTVPGCGAARKRKIKSYLTGRGIMTTERLATVEAQDLAALDGISSNMANAIVSAARRELGQ